MRHRPTSEVTCRQEAKACKAPQEQDGTIAEILKIAIDRSFIYLPVPQLRLRLPET